MKYSILLKECNLFCKIANSPELRNLALATLKGDHDAFLVLQDILEEKAGTYSDKTLHTFWDKLAQVLTILGVGGGGGKDGVFINKPILDINDMHFSDDWIRISFKDSSHISFYDSPNIRYSVKVKSPRLLPKESIVLRDQRLEIHIGDYNNVASSINIDGNPDSILMYPRFSLNDTPERPDDKSIIDYVLFAYGDFQRIRSKALKLIENIKRGIG